ncbi:MAG TPA: sigma-70 family RNA polymerase sigma factor [Cyclobacteriaceae bacterium]|nr:sigma-70 family RNA polymerase sigma factor [Cyclobacteriaceae bacterium]
MSVSGTYIQALNQLNKKERHAERGTRQQSAWTLLRGGNEKALLDIYDLCYDQLYMYGYQISRDSALTEDCIQDIFLELWEKRNKLPDVTFVNAYLLKILKRRLLKLMSSASGELNIDETTPGLVDGSMEDLIIDDENNHALAVRLKLALSKLTKRQREVIGLKFFNDLSYDEMAVFTGLSQQRIYNLVHEAVRHLRSSLFSTPRHVAALFLALILF